MLLSSTLEQPSKVSLCHSTKKLVTTESVGTLPVMVMVLAVIFGVASRMGAGEGTAAVSGIYHIIMYNEFFFYINDEFTSAKNDFTYLEEQKSH